VTAPRPDVTQLLRAWGDGDARALDELMPLVYEELRRRAAGYIRRERARQTLQPTALVNEAYLRLVDQRQALWRNRAQFFAVASTMMRRILVDRARAHRMAKRSGQWARVTLDEHVGVAAPAGVDIIDLDRALTKLAAVDERKARIAELRLFAGLSLEETVDVMAVSLATVERDWQFARAWLFNALSKSDAHDA